MAKSNSSPTNTTQRKVNLPSIRVTPDIKLQIEQKAQQSRQRVSEYILSCVLRRSNPPAIPAINLDTYSQLGRMVRLFNEMEKHLELLQKEFFNRREEQQAVFNSLFAMLYEQRELNEVIRGELLFLDKNVDELQSPEIDSSYQSH